MIYHWLVVINIFLISCERQVTEITIISAIHKNHKINNKYTYSDLFEFIETKNPDVIAVEIRPEDINEDSLYLSKFYPYEMHQITRLFKDKSIYGFDWLGDQIEGNKIPQDYFKSLDIIQLQNQIRKDSIFQMKLGLLDSLSNIKSQIVANSTLIELIDGRYDEINRTYYKLLNKIYKDTPYSKVARFYMQRDENISNHIINIIQKNKGKNLIFVMGADHRSYTIDRIKTTFNSEIENQEIILN